jgi:hypothetical protein
VDGCFKRYPEYKLFCFSEFYSWLVMHLQKTEALTREIMSEFLDEDGRFSYL